MYKYVDMKSTSYGMKKWLMYMVMMIIKLKHIARIRSNNYENF